MQTVSVDIGSTWTKAALFAHEGEELTLVNHVLTPTTTHHLADGFFASLNQVLNVADARPLQQWGWCLPLRWSRQKLPPIRQERKSRNIIRTS